MKKIELLMWRVVLCLYASSGIGIFLYGVIVNPKMNFNDVLKVLSVVVVCAIMAYFAYRLIDELYTKPPTDQHPEHTMD